MQNNYSKQQFVNTAEKNCLKPGKICKIIILMDCLQILERIFWSDNLKASCREQQFAKLCGVNEGLKGASDIGIS